MSKRVGLVGIAIVLALSVQLLTVFGVPYTPLRDTLFDYPMPTETPTPGIVTPIITVTPGTPTITVTPGTPTITVTPGTITPTIPPGAEDQIIYLPIVRK